MKICKNCNKLLNFDNFTKSKNVKDGYENKCKICRQVQRKKYKNNCLTCGKSFTTAYKKSKYCSPKCKPQSQRNRVVIHCPNCGKSKEVTPSRQAMYVTLYCSWECRNQHNGSLYRGENHHNYSKQSVNCHVCKKDFKRNNYEINRYKKNYCSLECKHIDYIKRFSGKNNPHYDTNKSDEDRTKNRNIEGYNDWLRQVYRRDNYTCQCCADSTGGNLNCHHILNYMEYPNLRTDVNNGITLCKKCHTTFHKTYGYQKNNKIQLNEFLKNMEIPSEVS